MASLKEVGERALIRNLMGIIRPGPFLGPEDDAAIGNVDGGRIVVSTDIVTFERHFPSGMTYEQFGWTAAAVNFSDIAAMGAKPIGLLTALAMPDDMDEDDLYNMVSGMDQCAEFCNTHIIGGDTKPGPGIIAGTALGTLEGRAPLLRSGARPGDMVAVTGQLGSAAAAFAAVESGLGDEYQLSALMVPVPKVSEGLILSASGAVTSCMDLSDGLAEAAKSICRASHIGMELQREFIPEGDDVREISTMTGADLEELLLYWGGDYELMFTFEKEKLDTLYSSDIEFSVIGMVTNGNGPYITESGERTMMKDGRY
ncbi:MAG: thiamine-phosphate kinase [Candidatus Methanoplasma sp.]|jgi:thiamine-monophosphate kinase|nr:thiamine-phosphate kinase [Candidatus Methanoplasma sp.]